jgi:nucleotide-binding universal stress UspA family protein
MAAPDDVVATIRGVLWASARHSVVHASTTHRAHRRNRRPHILRPVAGFSHIVVCLDDSPGAQAALDAARGLRAEGGTLTLLHVIAPPSFLTELAAGLGGGIIQDQTPLIEIARQWIATVADEGEDAVVLEGNPTHMVTEWAAEHDADVIVVARHGTPEKTVLGGFTQKLVGIAPCAVLIVHSSTADTAS